MDEGSCCGPGAGPPLGMGSSGEPNWLSETEQTAWLAVAAMMIRLPTVLDAQLRRDSRLGLFEYLVLSSLSMAEGRTRRMSELAALANGSLSRLSNVVKRLEDRDWVRREPDPRDGRYTRAYLTDAGWREVVAAAPGHVAAVRHFVIDGLEPEHLAALAEIGGRITGRMDPGRPFPPTAEDPTC